MAQIKTEKQYEAACNRINELLKIVGNDTPADDKNMLELDLISDSKLAEMLGLSAARLSEIITGKGEPSLKTGREISRKLNIDPAIVLGV